MLVKRILFVIVFVSAHALADEGMWMPEQLPRIEERLKAAGLKISPRELAVLTDAPMAAIVSLGGCSASFVSPKGLVLTNRHCVYGSVQYNSTPERNLLRDGFIARNLKEELPAAPNARVFVTADVQDVTRRVIDARTSRLTGAKRMQAIETNRAMLVQECERQPGRRCTVNEFYAGLQYRLIEQLEIRDVRLVYAPPEGVGRFGGDTDNFMWPRHSGDFAFLRAYVGPTGLPADRAADNVPYTPRHHLTLADRSPSPGDFAMTVGYPGRTNRYRLPEQVRAAFEQDFPEQSRSLREQIDIIARQTNGRPGARLAYASTTASLNNRLKKTQGLLDAYASSDALTRSQREAQGLRQWISATEDRTKAYGRYMVELANVSAQLDELTRMEQRFELATPRLLAAAKTVYRLAREKAKPHDLQRKAGYQERDWPRIQQFLEGIDKRYDEQVDRAVARHFLKRLLALPPQQRNRHFLSVLGLREGMQEHEIDGVLIPLYARTQLDDSLRRLSWMEQQRPAFETSDDAFIGIARALYKWDLRREARKRELEGRLQLASMKYMEALVAFRESRGEVVYPDANGTLRVSFGNVRGRDDGGADGLAWAAFTTLRGIQAKHTGEGEFAAPAKQIDAIKAGRFGRYRDENLDSVPVNYLATVDITGGNSGSAILDARGDLIGLAFDTSLDSVISDWTFNGERVRGISVDLRYIHWQLDTVDDARELLEELTARAGEAAVPQDTGR